MLKSFDPEIAAVRTEANDRRIALTPCSKRSWIDRTRNKVGTDSSTVAQYRSLFGWIDKDGRPRGTLLCYLNRHNRERPAPNRIHFIHQITPLWLKQFYDGDAFAHLSIATNSMRASTGAVLPTESPARALRSYGVESPRCIDRIHPNVLRNVCQRINVTSRSVLFRSTSDNFTGLSREYSIPSFCRPAAVEADSSG